MAKFIVTGEEVDGIDRKMCEIKRQLRQRSGSPLDPKFVNFALQDIVDGRTRKEEIGTVKMFDPHAYFKKHNGLWVSGSFAERILPRQKGTMPYRGLEGVTSHTLACNMSDMEIIYEFLGGTEEEVEAEIEVRKHSFTLDQIAAKIDLQSGGEDGELLNNGYANIFYVLVNGKLFAVSVAWDSSRHEWGVFDWPLNTHGDWLAGHRVFCNTTLAV